MSNPHWNVQSERELHHKIVARRDEYGFVCAIDVDGITVLHLQAGSERNEVCADLIAQALESMDEDRVQKICEVVGVCSVPCVSNLSTGSWVSTLREYDIQDLQRIFDPGIHITSITPPEQGWVVAAYCPLCKATTFILSPWAVKPSESDYIKMNDTCADDVLGFNHNMQMALDSWVGVMRSDYKKRWPE